MRLWTTASPDTARCCQKGITMDATVDGNTFDELLKCNSLTDDSTTELFKVSYPDERLPPLPPRMPRSAPLRDRRDAGRRPIPCPASKRLCAHRLDAAAALGETPVGLICRSTVGESATTSIVSEREEM